MDLQNEAPESDFQIISQVFRDGSPIPPQYTCKGQNVSPPLNFLNVPDGAQCLALIMHDPDAPVGDFTHWLVWDIPTSTETIAANSIPVGAVQGMNDMDEVGYTGPCPPAGTGTHRYVFEAYALSAALSLESGSNRAQLQQAMSGKVVAAATLVGTFAAD
ncbi:MAG TPA: YbhB/YbcL family Raf kinase inhibitor-like protein [Candidatus Saccharimonadales bacterium]|nr:YbhB/YbcL family Raf kinase inhibitor-like protein [Candidatus Saccharimonadales bacterium]